jgi:hypothetical protein
MYVFPGRVFPASPADHPNVLEPYTPSVAVAFLDDEPGVAVFTVLIYRPVGDCRELAATASTTVCHDCGGN